MGLLIHLPKGNKTVSTFLDPHDLDTGKRNVRENLTGKAVPESYMNRGLAGVFVSLFALLRPLCVVVALFPFDKTKIVTCKVAISSRHQVSSSAPNLQPQKKKM